MDETPKLTPEQLAELSKKLHATEVAPIFSDIEKTGAANRAEGMSKLMKKPLSEAEKYLAEQAAKKEALTMLRRGAMKGLEFAGPIGVGLDLLDPTEASADADLRYTPEEQQQKLQEFHKMKKLQELLGK